MINISPEKLKDILVKAGVIDSDSFDLVQQEAERKRQKLAEIIISQGLVNEDYLYLLVSKALGVERVNLGVVGIDEGALNLIPQKMAREKGVIAFGKEEDGRIKVAMEDPSNLETIDYLTLSLGTKINPYLATEEDLNRGFSLYGKKMTQDFKAVIEEKIKDSLRLKATGDMTEAADEVPVVELTENLFNYAISLNASDVHFEILDDAVLVRFRVDGVLHEIVRIPKEIHPAVIARIKILSGLRVDEHSRPQDGRFRYKVGQTPVDVRVSIMPTFYGEKVVMRLLSGAQKPLSLIELGIFEDDTKKIEEAISRSYGMTLVCGPTGSGKTTTIYSLMNMLNRQEVNIISIEDPIEYDMRYVNQVQVNEAAGITFASGLRSILRQDPNIVMVGEIRDKETANIAVQAALTGHLILSSLHTNDAPTAVPRLVDMGVPQFLVSAVLNNVIAQRLLRKIHMNCIESYTPERRVFEEINEQLRTIGIDPKTVKLPATFYRGKGCEGCHNIGFRGRVGIYEVMQMTDEMKNSVTDENFNLDRLQSMARQEGMSTMFEDGLKKVERGITTIEELFRVIRE